MPDAAGMLVSQVDVDAKRLGIREIIDAEQMHRVIDPYGVILHTQRFAEEQLRSYATEHGLELLTVRVSWECRVEAVAE